MKYIYSLNRQYKIITSAVLICGFVLFLATDTFSQNRVNTEITYDKKNQILTEHMMDYYYALITYDLAGNRNRKFISSGLIGIIEVGNNSKANNLNIYPVPATEEISVRFSIQNSSNVSFSIFSVDGKQHSKTEDYLYAGKNTHKINISKLPSGPYILEVIADGEINRKIFVVK